MKTKYTSAPGCCPDFICFESSEGERDPSTSTEALHRLLLPLVLNGSSMGIDYNFVQHRTTMDQAPRCYQLKVGWITFISLLELRFMKTEKLEADQHPLSRPFGDSFNRRKKTPGIWLVKIHRTWRSFQMSKFSPYLSAFYVFAVPKDLQDPFFCKVLPSAAVGQWGLYGMGSIWHTLESWNSKVGTQQIGLSMVFLSEPILFKTV